MDYAGGEEKLEAARMFINKYVSDHTNQMIPELIAKDVLDPLTRLVLINTVYFKGAIVHVHVTSSRNKEPVLLIF